MAISNQDITILQELAKKYMEVATLPKQQETINLWKALNRNQMQRPMVVIDQLPWHELNNEGELTCHVQDPFFQGIEQELRRTLYKWNHFPVDMVIDPFISIPKAIQNTGYGIAISEETMETDHNNSVISHLYQNQILEEEDIEKIKDMQITHDIALTEQRATLANDIFQGIAPVKLSGIGFHLGLWDHLSFFMGVEDAYYNIIDRPEFVHAILARMTDATIAGIEQANKLQLHDDIINTCHCAYIYNDLLLTDSGANKGPLSKNCWAFGMAQLFSSVSPATTAEFEIPYISKMAEYFGMIYYGCCDRLDDRLELVKQIPNLKKVSCSPWSDRNSFAEKIGKNLIMSSKPSPAPLATQITDVDYFKNDLISTCAAAKANNVNLELVLKDISTISYEPNRLTEWANTAMNIVNNY